jgi:predicted ATPase/class 3 adenylate cyclase
MNNLPSGTVTFLFTDIEGSTKLAQQYPDAMPVLLARHHAILHQSVQAQNGYVFQIVGDSFAVAFHSASDALNAALTAQRMLQNESWTPAPIKVRMGIHTGTSHLNDPSAPTAYSGYTTLAATQRIMSAGHGGQILLSGVTRELLRDVLPTNSELQDLGEKRLKDLFRAERLYQLNVSGLLSTFPPLKTLDSFPNNFPTQLTSFIGRENEITEVKRELELHRLVTLTGSGGTGKTRLSLQVAADLLAKFDHGTWFIELAQLTDPDLIPQTILSVIGIQEQQDKTPLAVLKEYLKAQQVLIVLDNCEHLVAASAQVANALLSAAPKLKVLASSREALGVNGEVAYPVPSLSLPDIKHLPDLEGLSQYEAVRLFIDGASLLTPHFVLDKGNAPYIAQICYRLDGIPLALELAAVRVKMLSVEQISKRLDDRFRLLTSGARTALPRQQTLRALIDWSYDILSNNERLLLRRLSVFAGGWTLEAAEEVCVEQNAILSSDILDLLTQLINKSLVVVMEHSQSGEARYGMLETIRQYAREKLLEAGGGEIVRDQQLAYFVKLTEQAEPNLRAFDMISWLDRLESELDNIRMVLEWARESDIEAHLRLASALWWFWYIRGHRNEGFDWLERGLAIEAAQRGDQPLWPERARLRGNALNVAGFLLRDVEKKSILLEEALNLFRELGTVGKQGMATTLRTLGNCKLEKGHNEQACELIEESLSIFRETGNQFDIAECLNLLVGLAMNKGSFEQARLLQEEALSLRKEIGDKDGMANSLYMLGQIAHSQSDVVRAESLYEESLTLFREIGNRSWILRTLGTLADVVSMGGDLHKAGSLIEEGLVLAKDLDDEYGIAHLMFNLADNARFQGDYDRALQLYEETLVFSKKIDTKNFIAYALYGKAEIARAKGDYVQALSFHHEALAIRRQIDHPFGITWSLHALAELAVIQGQAKRAIQLFSAIEAMYKRWAPGISPKDRAEHDQAIAVSRAAVGEEIFAIMWKAGMAMPAEQAIALALEE